MPLILKDVTAGYSQRLIDTNFRLIQDFINENTLKRQVERGEANQMLSHLVLSPTEIGIRVGFVSEEGVVGEDGDVCFIPVDYGTGFRLSQSVLETLHAPPSNLRLSQSFLELVHSSPSQLNLTQSLMEVLSVPPSDLRATQSILEVLSVPPSDLRATQSVLEVLHEL